MSEIELKLTIYRVNGSQEMRRVRLVSPSYEAINNITKKWVRGTYSIEYLDDEGDFIVVGSEDEWTECLDIWKSSGGGVLKLKVCSEGWHEKNNTMATAPPAPVQSDAVLVKGMSPWGKRCFPTDEPFCCRRNLFHPGSHGWRCVNFKKEPLVVEGKCTNCTYSATGITEGYCCNRCRHGKGGHGPRCRRIIHSEGKVDAEAFEREANHCCRRSLNRPGFHGRRCANFEEPPLVVEGQCTNCTYSATGITEGYCCNRCRHGKGGHGPRCRRIIHSEGRVDKESFEKEEHHCCRRNHHHPGAHGRRCANFEEPPLVVEGKCTNCTYSATGITEGYCCNRCRHGKGGHGPRCRRIIHSEGTVDAEAFEKEAEHCCRRNFYHPGCHTRRCPNWRHWGQLHPHHGGMERMVSDQPHVPLNARFANFYQQEDFVRQGQHCCKVNARWPGTHHRRCVNFQPANGKCANCPYACTGIADGFCCVACRRQPGSHGPRCKRITHVVKEDNVTSTEDTPQVPVPVDVVKEDVQHNKESSVTFSDPVKEVPPPVQFADQIDEISSMGFPITDRVRELLSQSNGSVEFTVTKLLS